MLLRARSNAWRVVVFNSRACGDSPVTTPQTSFQHLLQKQEGDRAMWEYPFAVAGVNITFMLIQMLDLEAVKLRNLVGATFLKFLAGAALPKSFTLTFLVISGSIYMLCCP